MAAAVPPASIADYVTAAAPAPSNVPPVVAPAPPPLAPVPTTVLEPAALPSPEQSPNTTSVVRDVKVRLGFAVFQVRQQWTISGLNTSRPKISRMSVTKL